MSKAFTTEDDREEPIIPPRAPLPAGVANLVTPRGLRLLRAELADLEKKRRRIEGESEAGRRDEADYRRRAAILAGRMRDLAERIASAEVVATPFRARDDVRFGARVVLRAVDGGGRDENERTIEIVGVDEADPVRGVVAFTSPIARAVLGCAVGDTASLETPRGEELLEVVSIEYPAD